MDRRSRRSKRNQRSVRLIGNIGHGMPCPYNSRRLTDLWGRSMLRPASVAFTKASPGFGCSVASGGRASAKA